jgi:methionine synthase II (cobalamin-independent)
MKRSTERILTTHVGSLARPDSLIPLLRLMEQGQPYDREELARLVREAVTYAVRKQVEAGIDIVTDGEQGKASFFGYIVERFSGFERKPATPGKEGRPRAAGRTTSLFPTTTRGPSVSPNRLAVEAEVAGTASIPAPGRSAIEATQRSRRTSTTSRRH